MRTPQPAYTNATNPLPTHRTTISHHSGLGVHTLGERLVFERTDTRQSQCISLKQAWGHLNSIWGYSGYPEHGLEGAVQDQSGHIL